MAVRRLHRDQPASFAFSPENQAWATTTIAKYPQGQQASAVLPLLWRGQEQDGWVTEPMIEHVADMLAMAKIRVLEVATFYTMFHLAPVGRKAHVQVCGTTPCMLRGSQELIALCKARIHDEPHHLSDDGDFSWEEVECLGACVNAPMVQVWKDTYEDLTPAALEAVLDAFARDRKPRPGPQVDRQWSAPLGGALTLTGEPGAGLQAEPASRVDSTAASNAGGKAKVAGAGARVAAAPAAGPSSAAEQRDEDARVQAQLDALPDDASAEDRANAVGTRPDGLAAPRGGTPDDLKQVKGIGRVNEDRLNALGLFHFDQIAALPRAQVLWLGVYLAFPGRIDREDWLGQSQKLASGEETDFSRRVAAGEVESSLDEEEVD